MITVGIVLCNWRIPRLICVSDTPMMVSNIFNVAPFQQSRTYAPGARCRKWNHLYCQSLTSLDLSVTNASKHTCFCSVFNLCIIPKIESVIDSSLSRAWLSIWGRNLKSLTGNQRVGVTPRFLLIIPPAGISSFFPRKVWIWPFNWSSRLPYSVTCDRDTKGFAGGQPTGFYLRSAKWFSRTQLALQSLAQCPKCAQLFWLCYNIIAHNEV